VATPRPPLARVAAVVGVVFLLLGGGGTLLDVWGRRGVFDLGLA